MRSVGFHVCIIIFDDIYVKQQKRSVSNHSQVKQTYVLQKILKLNGTNPSVAFNDARSSWEILGFVMFVWVDFPSYPYSQEKSILPTNHHREIPSSTWRAAKATLVATLFALATLCTCWAWRWQLQDMWKKYLVGWGGRVNIQLGRMGEFESPEKVSKKKHRSKEVIRNMLHLG